MKSVKHKRNQAKGGTAGDKQPGSLKAPALAVAQSNRRLWGLRFTAMLLPVLLVALVELGLRVGGWGYPTSFFLRKSQDGRNIMVDNPKFGWRFFPPALARAPRPLSLAARKPPGTVRIFVLGESAAMGDPDASYGFARQLERLLQARHPDQTVEVVNVAMTAINSHVIRQIARDCAPLGGDYWLVFAGNNEVVGPYGAGTVFGRQAPGLTAVRLSLALKSTRVGELLTTLTRSTKEPAVWNGLELFLDQQVAREDARLKNVYANFGANLASVIRLGQRSGAQVVLASVPVNLRDSPPFASLHRPGLSPAQLAEWEKCYRTGVKAEEQGKYDEALLAYGPAARIDGEYAEMVFRRAHCQFESKQMAAAEADYRLAVDLDALRFRADSRLNQIVRQLAAAQGAAGIDADHLLGARGEDIPGQNLFYDHVHLNFTGNYRVALLFAAELEKRWPGGSAPTAPWLPEAEVARRLAFTDFDRRRVGELMRARLQQAPFTGQSNFRRRDEHWRQVLAASPVRPASQVPEYQAALALAPQDWLLHANFGESLEAAGDAPGAAAQWREVSRILPEYPAAWFKLGHLARLAGDKASAEEFLEKGLKSRPDTVDLLNELGLLEASKGANSEAMRRFRAALRLQPGFSAARINLGLGLAKTGDRAGAAAQYREVLRWHPNNVEARINLANQLAAQGQTEPAITLYEEAIKLQPDNVTARYDLGKTLVAKGRLAEAVPCFEAVVRLRPGLAEVHYELAAALGRLGRDSAALDQLGEVVRLKPDFPEGHFNYGVVLAKTGRFKEAAAQFRETLRLRPDNAAAQRMLEQALRE